LPSLTHHYPWSAPRRTPFPLSAPCARPSPARGFLSSRSGLHRDLHSFPTRRSSDLSSVRFCACPGIKTALPSPGRASSDIALLRDRKSTRLNSSHGSISYAVFCLKKKIGSRRGHFHRGILGG